MRDGYFSSSDLPHCDDLEDEIAISMPTLASCRPPRCARPHRTTGMHAVIRGPADRRPFARAGRPCFLRQGAGIDARVEHGPAWGSPPRDPALAGRRGPGQGRLPRRGRLARPGRRSRRNRDRPAFFAAERNGYHGLVHGDACPDNVRFLDGRCRIFDSGHSDWGAVALDASYLLAPFPSDWCSGRLPASVAAPAMPAYHGRLEAAGIHPGPSWDVAMTAALDAWIVA